ncbi:MAG TPA: PIN domain-containing protein [Bacteroidetes bacterium]|nr:PIN domain-containing protein [Bacteroidota bacterium]HEX04362.1 PIN domain-containing protein [Bacteroidota bacterium]
MISVLDASALLAYLHQEPGWEAVRKAVGGGYVGAVNWSEVAQKTAHRGLDVGQVRGLLEEVGLSIVPFTSEQAETTALLWEKTRNNGLSLADRSCLALAIVRNATVFTTDRVWAELDLGLDIRVVR